MQSHVYSDSFRWIRFWLKPEGTGLAYSAWQSLHLLVRMISSRI